MNRHLLLVSYVEGEMISLRSKLQDANPDYLVDVAHNVRQAFNRLAHNPPHIIVMNFDSLSELVVHHVRNMKSVSESKPLLVMGRIDRQESLQAISAISNTIFLEKPFVDKDLDGLTQKLMAEREVAQRIHRRYNTSQKANIEIYGKNVESETTLYNMSRGGAYFELTKQPDIVVGDIVKLNVDLAELKHNYRVHAKVIWTTPKGPSTGGYGVGVEFIRSDKLFQELSSR